MEGFVGASVVIAFCRHAAIAVVVVLVDQPAASNLLRSVTGARSRIRIRHRQA